MKSEPDVFGIEDLKREKRSLWDGVRNYQARNYMTQQMTVGDAVIFYHSNTKPPGAAGLAEVCRQALPDPTQFDPKSDYFDAKASPEKPIWYCVEVEYKQSFRNFVSLEVLNQSKPLQNLIILKKGNRLSITPITQGEYEHIVTLGKK